MDNLSGILLAMQGAISQGILWGIMTLGLYITYKVLNYADLTVDGSFALGGAMSAILIVKGIDPLLTLFFATLAGMLSGVVTGFLHTKLKIPAILAGILSMIALYSINIRIMGKPNISLLGEDTIVSQIMGFTKLSQSMINLLIGAIFACVIIGIMYWFFGTEIGCAIRATGNNEYMVRALGGNTDMMKIIGLLISNGLVALSGALVAQSQGYADVGMGTGVLVIGLASIIIGEVIFGKRFNFSYKLMSVVFGSVLYRMIIAIVLNSVLKSSDLKLLTAVIVAMALSIPVIKEKDSEAFLMLKLTDINKTFNKGTINEKNVLSWFNLHLKEKDFVTVIGGNGAGKSTVLNLIAGVHSCDAGSIILNGQDITSEPEHIRAKNLGVFFQDPMMGTAAEMGIEENLAMALRRNKRRGLSWGITHGERTHYVEYLKILDLGLETRLKSKVGLLSGGQRQALTLLMATLQKPKLLLLDEHTAALDPKTAKKVLEITETIVVRDQLTTLMVTHNMKDAIRYGNRLIMMNEGRIIFDVSGEAKKQLKVEDLLKKFETEGGEGALNDRMVLA